LKDDEETAANLSRTALFSTLKACLENRMFEPASPLHPMGPAEAMGACSNKDGLGFRFTDQEDSAKMALATDMKIEDKRLEVFIKTCQLETWWQECLTLAQESVDEVVHQKTIEGAEMKKAAEEIALMEKDHIEKQRNKAIKSATVLAPLHNVRMRGGLAEDAGGRNLRSSSRKFS